MTIDKKWYLYTYIWASGKPTCSCHIFYTNRRFPVCGYRHLAEKIWGCRGWQYYYLPRTVNCWGCRRKRRNCQSHVTADRTNRRYIYRERFNDMWCLSVTCDRSVVFSGYSLDTNKTDRHDATEILLKVDLNIIALTLTCYWITLPRCYLTNCFCWTLLKCSRVWLHNIHLLTVWR